MGSVMSVNSSKTVDPEAFESSKGEHNKRQRTSPTLNEKNPRLIPSLPDEISIQILARIPRIHYLKMKLVSRAWKSAIISTELYSVRKELGKTEEWLYLLTKVENERLLWYALDPMSRIWQRLPEMPGIAVDHEPRKGLSVKLADTLLGWLGKKGSVNPLPFHGCAVGSLGGSLYVIGGLCKTSALRSVWRYDPVRNSWTGSTPMSTGRAFCKTGTLNGNLYVVGGVTRGPRGLASVQSAEVFDPKTGLWSGIPSMPFSKARALPTAFLADLLKPIATGMTSYQGKLFVSQSLYCWPFFVDVGGEVYDPERDSWFEMPAGMGDGWPVKQSGSKISVAIGDELYALEPSSSLESARIKVYDHRNDIWKSLIGDVPIFDFDNSESSSYLLAGLLGKLHVITKDSDNKITVLQLNVENRCEQVWRVLATWNSSSSGLVSCQTLDV